MHAHIVNDTRTPIISTNNYTKTVNDTYMTKHEVI
jgi:hypothetical protein